MIMMIVMKMIILFQPEWRRGLIPLPHRYADLMNLSANFCCENSVTRESKTPALCLVCGLMVCSQSHCCETIIGGVSRLMSSLGASLNSY